jgi:hypothetical protein
MLKPLHPIPAIRRGMRLYPDDPNDPWVFRVEMPGYGQTHRVVFDRGAENGESEPFALDLPAGFDYG